MKKIFNGFDIFVINDNRVFIVLLHNDHLMNLRNILNKIDKIDMIELKIYTSSMDSFKILEYKTPDGFISLSNILEYTIQISHTNNIMDRSVNINCTSLPLINIKWIKCHIYTKLDKLMIGSANKWEFLHRGYNTIYLEYKDMFLEYNGLIEFKTDKEIDQIFAVHSDNKYKDKYYIDSKYVIYLKLSKVKIRIIGFSF